MIKVSIHQEVITIINIDASNKICEATADWTEWRNREFNNSSQRFQYLTSIMNRKWGRNRKAGNTIDKVDPTDSSRTFHPSILYASISCPCGTFSRTDPTATP